MIAKTATTLFFILFVIANSAGTNIYYIPPNYSAQAIPRGYQPPPAGILANEFNYGNNEYFQQALPPAPQQYTIIRFNSKDPYPALQPQKQYTAFQQPKQKQRSGFQQQQFQQTSIVPQVTQQKKADFQRKVDSFPQEQKKADFQRKVDSFPQEQKKADFQRKVDSFPQEQKKQLWSQEQKHHYSASEPTLINTLIQVFSGDVSDKEISLTEARKISAIEDGSAIDLNANFTNQNRVVLLKRLDTKSQTFVLPIGPKNKTSRFVAVKAFAATNSSKITHIELESELNRELDASIPLIIEELNKIQHEKEKHHNKSTTTISPILKVQSKKFETTTTFSTTTEIENVKSNDLIRLIEEGLAEIDESLKPKTTTTPLIVFTKTTSFSKPKHFSTTKNAGYEKTKSTTLSFSSDGNDIIIPEAEDKFGTDLHEVLTTPAPVTKFFGLNKFLPVTNVNSTSLNQSASVQYLGTTVFSGSTVATTEHGTIDNTITVPTQFTQSSLEVTAAVLVSEQSYNGNDTTTSTSNTKYNVTLNKNKKLNIEYNRISTSQPALTSSKVSKPEEINFGSTTLSTLNASSITSLNVNATKPNFIESTEATLLNTDTTNAKVSDSLSVTLSFNPGTENEDNHTQSSQIQTKISSIENFSTTNANYLTDLSSTTTSNDPISSTIFDEIPTIIKTSSENEESCVAEGQPPDDIKGDVLFLLDGSTAVGNQKFQQSIQLIHDTVKNFGNNFGPNGIQVSLIQYNEEPMLEFSFRGHKCLSNVLSDIENTKFMTGDAGLNRAIEKVMKFAFTKIRGDRPDVPNILVLVTSGQLENQVQVPLELTKNNDTTVMVIATVDIKPEELSMLNNENSKNIFNLTELKLKTPLADRLAERIRHVLQDQQQTEVGVAGSDSVMKSLESIPTFETLTEKKTPLDFEHDSKAKTVESDLHNTNHQLTNVTLNNENHLSFGWGEGTDSLVKVDCLAGGIRVNFKLPSNFKGLIVAKDFETDPKCVTEIQPSADNGDSQQREVEIYHPNCGVSFTKSEHPRGINESIVLSVIHDQRFETGQDRSFVLQCFIPLFATNKHSTGMHDVGSQLSLNDENFEILETNLNIVPGMALSKTISVVGAPPKCEYSLRRDSPNGPILNEANIGEEIYHRWECDTHLKRDDVNTVYGLHIYDCQAGNQNDSELSRISSTEHQFVDKHGCTTDGSLFEEIIYSEDSLIAYAKAYVFKPRGFNDLKFSCKIGLCIRDGDGCEGYSPPICQASNVSELLLSSSTHSLRQMDTSIEAAMSSFVETPHLSILASKKVTHNNTAARSRFGASAEGIRIFTPNNKNNLNAFFIFGFLMLAIILGAILGFLCYFIVRFLNCFRLSTEDDIASLVESGKFEISQKNTNNCNSNDALSFNATLSPLVNTDSLSTYAGTLERKTRATILNNEEKTENLSEIKKMSLNSASVSTETGNYNQNITNFIDNEIKKLDLHQTANKTASHTKKIELYEKMQATVPKLKDSNCLALKIEEKKLTESVSQFEPLTGVNTFLSQQNTDTNQNHSNKPIKKSKKNLLNEFQQSTKHDFEKDNNDASFLIIPTQAQPIINNVQKINDSTESPINISLSTKTKQSIIPPIIFPNSPILPRKNLTKPKPETTLLRSPSKIPQKVPPKLPTDSP